LVVLNEQARVAALAEKDRIESQILKPLLTAGSQFADYLETQRCEVIREVGGNGVVSWGYPARHRIKLVLKSDPQHLQMLPQTLNLINESMQGVPARMQGVEVVLYRGNTQIQRPPSREEIEAEEASKKAHEKAVKREKQRKLDEAATERKEGMFEAAAGMHPYYVANASSELFFKHVCKTVFQRADVNHDGALDLQEVNELTAQLCQQLHLTTPEDDKIEHMFHVFDKSRDNLLQLDEFAGFYKALLKITWKKLQETAISPLTLQSSLYYPPDGQAPTMVFHKLSGAEVCTFSVAGHYRLSRIFERVKSEVNEKFLEIDVILPGGDLLGQVLSENPLVTLGSFM